MESLYQELRKKRGNCGTEQGENSSQQSEEKFSSEQEQSGQENADSTQSSNIKTYKMETTTLLDTNNLNQIDWNKVKSTIEILYTSWITMKIDLREIGINEDLLNEFSEQINNITVSIKNENKIQTMQGLTGMYEILYKCTEEYSTNNYTISTIKTKTYTLNAYNYIENKKWEEAKAEMQKAEDVFANIKNTSDIEDNKKVDIERIIVLITEMKNSLTYKDKELALIKYKNLIQELSVL